MTKEEMNVKNLKDPLALECEFVRSIKEASDEELESLKKISPSTRCVISKKEILAGIGIRNKETKNDNSN